MTQQNILQTLRSGPPGLRDFYLDVARGLIPGISHINKFGRNTDVDTSEEDIWDGGGTWAPPTTARTHQLVSTSTADASGGTGARTVEIFGLDAGFVLQNEIVTMNGTTNVATASAYTMIHRMIVRTAGSGEKNAGTITATADTDGTVTAQITIGFNQTLMAIFQIPANTTGYMRHLCWYLNKAGGAGVFADMRLYAKPPGEVWQLKHVAGLASDGDNSDHVEFLPHKVFLAKTLIRVASIASALNQDVSVEYDVILVQD